MATNAQKAQDQYEHYMYCRNEGGHDAYLRTSERAKAYYASKQWDPADKRRRTGEGRLSFEINEIFRTINAVRGEMSQLSSDVRYDPLNGDAEVAHVLNRLSEHTDRINKLYMHDDRIILDGLLTGRGFYRIRVDFDDNLQGQVNIGRYRPENVVLDAEIRSPDPDTWERVFTTEIVSTEDIKQMFGRSVPTDFAYMPYADWLDPTDRTLAQVLGNKTALPGDDPLYHDLKRHRLISQQWREYKYKDVFVDKQTGDFREIPENWSREKIDLALSQFDLGVMRRRLKTLRWRVTCNNVVLHDEDSPYQHFDIVPFFPWFLDDHPLSLFEVLRGPQDLLNYTVNEETHILGTTSHSGWKVKNGSLSNMTPRQLEQKGSKNGLVMVLEDTADAERIQPGQPASGFQNFGDRARQWINELASVTPSMLGTQRADANGRNIGAQLTRAPVNLHAPLTAFQYAKQLLAERKLALFQTFYDETRILKVAVSSYGQAETVAINVPGPEGRIINNITIGKYIVRMMPVGSRQAAEEMSFDQLLAMRELGINVPNSLLVASSALNAKTDVIEQLLEANNGELNPEEQRMRQLEVERAETDLEDAIAGVEAKRAAAELARGRAARAFKEAEFDNRKANSEIAVGRLQSEHERSIRQLEYGERKSQRDAAIKLTEIATKKEIADKKPAKTGLTKPPKKQPR